MVKQTRHLWDLAENSVSPEVSEKLEADAAKHWNTFYQQNQTNFFKDRHYLEREFPELARPGCVVLEVGCGVGNTAYPLLKLNPTSTVFACDFAPEAVQLVKANPEYASNRIHAFVADITCSNLAAHVHQQVEFCTMVFVLSAIAPAKMPAAIANVASVLKPGTGQVLVRDYAEGDLAQQRLAGPSRSQRLSDNFYVRSDGTRAYYFDEAGLKGLFHKAGFTCADFRVHERQIENRKQQVVMHRRWVQATFCYATGSLPSHENNDDNTQQANHHQPAPTQAQPQQHQHQTEHGCGFAKHRVQQADIQPASRPTELKIVNASPSQQAIQCEHQLECTQQSEMLSQVPASQAGPAHDKIAHAVRPADVNLQPQFSQLHPDHASEPSASSLEQQQQQRSLLPGRQTEASTAGHQHQSQAAIPESEQQHETGSGHSAWQQQLQMAGSSAAKQQHEGRMQHQEWDTGGSTPDLEQLTGCLFNDDQLEEVTEEVPLEDGLEAQVVSVSRQYRNTLEHTGLMCWESSIPLARFLLAAPTLIQGKQVLEVGCGVNPVCCLAGVRHCRRYVATDGSREALQGLARNLDRNCRRVIMERVRVRQLVWGSNVHKEAIQQAVGLFDVILGADVVYTAEAISSLFTTLQALLCPKADAMALLCYIVRRVSEKFLQESANAHGLQVLDLSPELTVAAKQVSEQDLFQFMLLKRKQ